MSDIRKIKSVLLDIGLNEKEVLVYIAALSLHDCSLLQLAHKAHIKRTTVYAVVESLVEKGLLGTYQSKSGTRVRAQDPEQLLAQAEKRVSDVHSIMNDLSHLHRSDETTPQVTFYKGKKGYHTVLEDSLKKHSADICFVATGEENLKVMTDDYIYEYYVPTRVKRRIRSRELIFPKDLDKFTVLDHQKDLREIRVLPDQFYSIASKAIYGDKVALFSSAQEAVCTLIESPAIADLERNLFEYMWQLSLPLKEYLSTHA